MDEKFFTLKEVTLNNNCPECFSRKGLQLTFMQKFVENTFYKAITDQTIQKRNCTICKTEIFSIRWTNDIEQVVDYQKRAITAKPKSFKIKKLSWIIIITIGILLLMILLFATGIFNISI